MKQGPKISQAAIQRAIRAARAEGLDIFALEVDMAEGVIRILSQPPAASSAADAERRMIAAFGR